MEKTALLIVDIQRDYFPEGQFPLPNMESAAVVAARAINWFRAQRLPVIFMRHVEQDPETTFFVPGSPGTEIHPQVKPGPSDIVLEKHYPNSFRDTSLQLQLHKLGIERLAICGAMSNMCIDATARAAVDFGFECVVIHDACAASDLEFQGALLEAEDVHAVFMGALASGYGHILTLDEFAAMTESK